MRHNFPAGIRSITIMPHRRNHGLSWGLEYPLIFAHAPRADCWFVWDRHTGDVKAIFPSQRNVHGYDRSRRLAEEFSKPASYDENFNVFDLDSVP